MTDCIPELYDKTDTTPEAKKQLAKQRLNIKRVSPALTEGKTKPKQKITFLLLSRSPHF